MCNRRNSVKLDIQNKKVKLDACLVTTIAFFNVKGIKTLASCCGHGRYFPTIIVEFKDENNKPYAWEYFNCIRINRKRRFYKKDKKGYYYIPELNTPKN